ncbi:hypothetical protein [Streptomyces sp. NPDC008150]|uniref:hypothetical protein n=1 Tax=Streptomyces sp. NPDC008150 TaxID=3364816 RepID=UPI0036E20F4B
MTLPLSGKTPWPPVQFEEPFHDMEVWRAWYGGDTAHLAQVYGGPESYAQNPRAREFFDLNKPSQFRGGLVGGLARMFWGEPITPGQPAAKLHVPLAADIAELSANLLWADVPSVTVDSDSATDKTTATATTAQIKRYLDDRGHATMREGSERAAAQSGVYVRVVWDTALRPRPWWDLLGPDAVIPEWRWGILTAATVWREVPSPTGGAEVWRLLERHESGSIEYGLYKGSPDVLGMMMGLADHPDTAGLVGRVDAKGRQATRVNRLLVHYVPNIRPQRMWDHIEDAQPFGRSDFAGIEPMMGALDEAWTSWMRDLRLGKARIMLPQSMLETDGPGSGGMFDLDREVFVQLNMLDEGTGASALAMNQFAIRVDEHERTTAALRRQILSSAGYSAQSFGEEGTVAATATEVVARKEESLTTRGTKILYQRPALLDLITTTMHVDVTHCKAKGIDPAAELTAVWPQAVQPDPEAVGRTLSFLETAGAISTYMKVKTLRPEWDEEDVQAEVARIRGDQAAKNPLPVGDPFGAHGGGPAEGEDPAAGEAPDGAKDGQGDDPKTADAGEGKQPRQKAA